MSVEVIINGDTFQFEQELSVVEILKELDIDVHRVVVEHNQQLIHQAQFQSQMVRASDQLELLEFVGGG